jgi:ubiquitin
MLPEDELDFEDFGDLGEIEGPELTNEELEALEQELRSENVSTLNELEDQKPVQEPTPTTKTESTTAERQKDNQNIVNNSLEEGETPNDVKFISNKSESHHRQDNSSSNQQQQQQQQQFNNNNNNNNNNCKNNGYNQNGFYGQQPMPMK